MSQEKMHNCCKGWWEGRCRARKESKQGEPLPPHRDQAGWWEGGAVIPPLPLEGPA